MKELHTKYSIQMHEKFCIVPFVKIVQDPQGTVRPCHWHESLEKDYSSLNEAFLGDEMESIREDMRSGVKRAQCYKCHDSEDNGIESQRITSNYIHRHIVQDLDNYDLSKFSGICFIDFSENDTIVFFANQLFYFIKNIP